MKVIIVMAHGLKGVWEFYGMFPPMDLTDAQIAYINGMGATMEERGGAVWIKAKNPQEVAGYLRRLKADRKEMRR